MMMKKITLFFLLLLLAIKRHRGCTDGHRERILNDGAPSRLRALRLKKIVENSKIKFADKKYCFTFATLSTFFYLMMKKPDYIVGFSIGYLKSTKFQTIKRMTFTIKREFGLFFMVGLSGTSGNSKVNSRFVFLYVENQTLQNWQ
jgi:hypothetical protein